jgi:membrane-bound lytic murein transglycosylase D
LGYIGERFGCKVSEIKAWNGMYSDKLSIGQKLVLYVSEDKIKSQEEFEKAKAEAPPEIGIKKEEMTTERECNCKYHVIKEGDTLWDIAQMYDGATVETIMSDNNITSSTKLKLDAILIIKSYE